MRASFRSDDVLPRVLPDLTQDLPDSLSMGGEGLGSTKNLPRASEIFEACSGKPGCSSFTMETLAQCCGQMPPTLFTGSNPTCEFLRGEPRATLDELHLPNELPHGAVRPEN
jgi:hypothetical protein